MWNRPVRLSPFALTALLTGCGYIGEPLPPALNIPVRMTDLRAVERGGQLLIEFTLPQTTTEGLLLKQPGEVEVRAGPGGAEPFDVHRWAAGASRIDVSKPEFGSVRVEAPAKPWIGREIILSARSSNPKGRFSEWSNLVVLEVVDPLAPPVELRAEDVPEGLRLNWRIAPERPGVAVRVYRKGPTDQQSSQVARVEGNQWIDRQAQYGKRYEYTVQAVLKAGQGEAESLRSPPTAFVPEDRFPPAVPSGLAAVASTNSIELTWERNTEPDLAGYRVYRAVADGDFQRISDLIAAPSFSDRRVESGKRYRYAVASVDQLGHESAHSPAVEMTVP